MSDNKIGRLLTEKQVEQKFGIPVRRLQNDRFRKSDGIPFLKFGRSVLYDELEVQAYLDRCRRRSTSDAGGEGLCNIHYAYSPPDIEGHIPPLQGGSKQHSKSSHLEGNS